MEYKAQYIINFSVHGCVEYIMRVCVWVVVSECVWGVKTIEWQVETIECVGGNG